MTSKALFLDRDGVVNVDFGYVHRIEQFEFINGIFTLTRTARKKGYKIIIITNQSGIGRGIFSENDFHKLTAYMEKKFIENGANVDEVLYSPYHPIYGKGRYQKDDFSRKPKPGMILEAKRRFGLDLTKSIFIGDKITDMKAGNSASVGINLLLGNQKKPEEVSLKFTRIYNLIEAVKYL